MADFWYQFGINILKRVCADHGYDKKGSKYELAARVAGIDPAEYSLDVLVLLDRYKNASAVMMLLYYIECNGIVALGSCTTHDEILQACKYAVAAGDHRSEDLSRYIIKIAAEQKYIPR